MKIITICCLIVFIFSCKFNYQIRKKKLKDSNTTIKVDSTYCNVINYDDTFKIRILDYCLGNCRNNCRGPYYSNVIGIDINKNPLDTLRILYVCESTTVSYSQFPFLKGDTLAFNSFDKDSVPKILQNSLPIWHNGFRKVGEVDTIFNFFLRPYNTVVGKLIL